MSPEPSTPPFAKVLIANRGEIAVRVQRSCRELGIRTVAVYSDADRDSLHVRFADEAVALGGLTPAESYLRGERIVEIAQETGAEAIHPGFGFLSENSGFARAVEEAGLAFVGPPARSMEVMGDKLASRRAMTEAGVPVVPGTVEPIADAEQARTMAEEIGFPVMLKASAGGGGKGIRVVRQDSELEPAFRTASQEAENAFGDGRMYLEKYLERPRHIEIQVLGDQHGTVLHFGERECSIQRRHQKLIEECPAPGIDAGTRARMGQAAIDAARAVDYHSAGTVEFLYDAGAFYFLEMNTRLQVEHGVTELAYGVDLVEWMLRVAAGERLDRNPAFAEGDLHPRGHAIEVRLNAEDPAQGFLPSIGTIRNLRLPGGPGLRIDAALYQGMLVTPYYDSMLGKLMTHGVDREQARQRMVRALQELHIGGVATSAGVALDVLLHPEFRAGAVDTGWLERRMEDGLGLEDADGNDLERAAAIVGALHRSHRARRDALTPARPAPSGASAWRAALRPGAGRMGGWR